MGATAAAGRMWARRKNRVSNFFIGKNKKGKQTKKTAPEPQRIHRPAVDSDSKDYSNDDDSGSYISGEYDEEFDNCTKGWDSWADYSTEV